MVIPSERFPERLAELGYEVRTLGGVEVIVPPLCAVPAGEFLMGSDLKRDHEADSDEKPQHWVSLPAYQIARYPVTVAEYACFVRTGQRAPGGWERLLGRLDHPVVGVSWRNAVAYAAWLAKLTGQPWRLPTEAEWEKAARGTDGRRYPWGDAFDKTRCNTDQSGIKVTTPVGTYPQGASPCGAQDMAGNVFEWTSSVYKRYPYNSGDGRERVDTTERRVLHGGSWCDVTWAARTAFRLAHPPNYIDVDVGFRLVCAVPGSAILDQSASG